MTYDVFVARKFINRTRLSIVALCFFLAAQAFGNQGQATFSTESEISVRISANKARFRPGEPVVLHVEIRNEGPKDVFILKELQGADNSLSKLDLNLYYGGHVDRPTGVMVADCFCSGRGPDSASLATELSKFWIALSPGHFYGGDVTLTASRFERLSVSGRYRIQGKYVSRGFWAEDINNPLIGYAEEVKQLPYESWTGEVETNSVWIEVVDPERKGQ